MDPEDELTVDLLTRDWRLHQRRHGHRHSTDDLLTGWYAAQKAPGAVRVLDLGAGIGGVGLLVLWQLPQATLTAVEAQAVSFSLLRRNISDNGLDARVRALHGDLRDVRFGEERFDLVTGSPPYWDVKDGVVPADSQKAHARFELRGDVRDYCHAARASMASGGRFVFCFPTAQQARAERAVSDAGLALLSSRDVVPRVGAPPLFTLFCCQHAEEGRPEVVREPVHAVRDEHGVQTAEHLAARATFGFGQREAP